MQPWARPLGRTVHPKSPLPLESRGDSGTHALQNAFPSSPCRKADFIVQKEHVINGKPEVPAVL